MKNINEPLPLDIKKYTKGICFLCLKPTDEPESYIHKECAFSYYEHREAIKKELLREFIEKSTIKKS